MKKLNKLLCLSICLIIFTVSCSKNEKIEEISEQQNFKNGIQNIANLINSNGSINPISYIVYNGNITGDDSTFYDASDYNLIDGVIYKNEKGEMYLSLKNNKFCAIKDFKEDKVSVYNIDEEEKCHKFYFIGIEPNLVLIPIDAVSEEIYVQGTKSNNYILLLVQENILDNGSVKYQWYRNGEAIENSNIFNYSVSKDYEDANYYLEIITSNGDRYLSNTVNVKIDRNE